MAQGATAAQEFVPIDEVRDGIVVLKDGGLRAVLMTSSLNFALKSGDEQQAIIAQFQNMLNALDFTVQIFVQSRELDIRPYVALLEERYEAQLDDLMKVQVREYIEFVKTFTESANIMTKNFFIIVPYTPPILESKSKLLSRFLGTKKEDQPGQTKGEATFEESRVQLEQRVSVVQQGIQRMGIRGAQLGTEEVVELFYTLFNPGELEKPIDVSQQAENSS